MTEPPGTNSEGGRGPPGTKSEGRREGEREPSGTEVGSLQVRMALTE